MLQLYKCLLAGIGFFFINIYRSSYLCIVLTIMYYWCIMPLQHPSEHMVLLYYCIVLCVDVKLVSFINVWKSIFCGKCIVFLHWINLYIYFTITNQKKQVLKIKRLIYIIWILLKYIRILKYMYVFNRKLRVVYNYTHSIHVLSSRSSKFVWLFVTIQLCESSVLT